MNTTQQRIVDAIDHDVKTYAHRAIIDAIKQLSYCDIINDVRCNIDQYNALLQMIVDEIE